MTLQPLPLVTDDTRAFWQGGADGTLRIHRCGSCSTWFHPPAPVCPACLSRDVAGQPTSGRATVRGFTINAQPWVPGMEVPFVLAVVALDDAPGVQLTTRLVDVDADSVAVGMHVEVSFEEVADGIHLPLFTPLRALEGGR